MNALGDDRVAEFFNDNFICTYLKVGTFEIVNGKKQGGNVASYFCLPDGSVLHAIAGKTKADRLLDESRYAMEIRKFATTASTKLATGEMDEKKFTEHIRRAHAERYFALQNHWHSGSKLPALPMKMPMHAGQQAQAHWLLAKSPLAELETVYPIVWTQILNERLSALPVARQ